MKGGLGSFYETLGMDHGFESSLYRIRGAPELEMGSSQSEELN